MGPILLLRSNFGDLSHSILQVSVQWRAVQMRDEGMGFSSWGFETSNVIYEVPKTEMKFGFVTNHSLELDVLFVDVITIS